MAFPSDTNITSGFVNRCMGAAGPSGNDTFTTAAKVLIDDSVTFTAISGHTYKVSWSTQMAGSASPVLATVTARWEPGDGQVTTSSTLIFSRVANLNTGNDSYHFARCVTGLSGLVTVGITAFTNTGTCTVYGSANGRELLVKDLGL
jgi:hypothetical protein